MCACTYVCACVCTYACTCAYTCVRVSVGSICNTISKANNIFGALINIYYLATVCNYKAVFIMTNSYELKVGGAGSNSPAEVSGKTNVVYLI